MSILKDTSIIFPVKTEGRSFRTDTGSQAWTVSVSGTYTVPRTRIGERLPHWRDVINSGGNATTPLSGVMSSVDYTRTRESTDWVLYRYPSIPGIGFRRENRGDTFLRNNQNSPILTSSLMSPKIDISFVDNLARASFYKKVRSIHTQFEGYIFAGELGETLRMLRNPLVGLRSLSKDFLDTLRKRKRANPKKWTKDLGGAWLEQSFGWNPLLNDVKDAVKAYRRLVKPVKVFKISSGAVKWYDVTKLNGSIYWPGSNVQYDSGNYYRTVSSIVAEKHTVRYKGAVVKRTKAPQWQNDDLFGFEPQNFIPAAWELLPWSFLADYFTNIGDILNASIVSTRDLAWVNRSAVQEVTKSGEFELFANENTGPGPGWVVDAKSSSRHSHLLTRKVVSRSAGVDLTLPTLQFNFDLTGGQLANIDALLTQANALHPQHNPRNWHR